MRARLAHRGSTLKVVHVRDAVDASPHDILTLALNVARETRSSIFGHSITTTDDDVTVVTLHTD